MGMNIPAIGALFPHQVLQPKIMMRASPGATSRGRTSTTRLGGPGTNSAVNLHPEGENPEEEEDSPGVASRRGRGSGRGRSITPRGSQGQGPTIVTSTKEVKELKTSKVQAIDNKRYTTEIRSLERVKNNPWLAKDAESKKNRESEGSLGGGSQGSVGSQGKPASAGSGRAPTPTWPASAGRWPLKHGRRGKSESIAWRCASLLEGPDPETLRLTVTRSI